jgi:hypothetical protein
MRLNHRDFPGRRSALRSIEIQGDSLLWTYQTGLFTHNASVPISSLVYIRLDNNELIWKYRIFANDGSGREDVLTETLSAAAQTQSENDSLARIYWSLLETVNPSDSPGRRNEDHQSKQWTSTQQEHGHKEDFNKNESKRKAYADARRDSNSGSSSNSSGGQTASQSSASTSPSSRNEIRIALRLLGSGLSNDKKRKLKSTLRLVHHPDYGGDQDFFIELESALVELEW